MSIQTIYRCDRCGERQEGKALEQFWCVRVQTKAFNAGHGYSDGATIAGERERQVCRPCLEQLGIAVQPKTVLPQPPPTLESTIIELVRMIVRGEQTP